MNSSQQYEFDEEQKAIMERLYRSMRSTYNYFRTTGIIVGLVAVMLMADYFREPKQARLLAPIATLAAALFLLVIGNSTRKAGMSFHRLLTTSGQDMTNLMAALDKLHDMYARVNLVATIYTAVLGVAIAARIILGIVAANNA